MQRKLPPARKGTVTVELAMTLPIIFALVFGAIDFSRANMIRNTLDNAAFEAARKATLPGATTAEVVGKAREVLNLLSIKDANIVVTPNTIAQDTQKVTVSISVNLGRNLYASSQILRNMTIKKSCTLTREEFAAGLTQ